MTFPWGADHNLSARPVDLGRSVLIGGHAEEEKSKRPVEFVASQDEREARVTEAARRAYRLANEKLHEARDPAAPKEAYEAVWEASD